MIARLLPDSGRAQLQYAVTALSMVLLVGLGCAPSADAQSVQEAMEVPEGYETAVFAGGCFWCMEPPFDKLDGVTATLSGYAGGEEPDPSYEEVSSGRTGHAEVVRVTYDPEVVSYEELLGVFWKNHDPLTADRQFCDRGSQYRPAVFYANEEQRRLAQASKEKWRESGRFEQPIVTEITELERFWPAEEYHQDFYEKNPVRYEQYRIGCRRDARLQELWGDS